jgi:hypothetical protein
VNFLGHRVYRGVELGRIAHPTGMDDCAQRVIHALDQPLRPNVYSRGTCPETKMRASVPFSNSIEPCGEYHAVPRRSVPATHQATYSCGSSPPLPSVGFPLSALGLVQWRAGAYACALANRDNYLFVLG